MADQPIAMFIPEANGRFIPTAAAIGAWSRDALHGAAVIALFAGRLSPSDRTLARLAVDLVAPVPNTALRLEIGPSAGGRRTQRREAVLYANDRPVANARSLTIVRAELDLPQKALRQEDPFAGVAIPDLHESAPELLEIIGWENFHSLAVATASLTSADGHRGSSEWVALTMPVVAGEPLLGSEIAAAAADLASGAIARRLPWEQWSFKNADLTLHLTRAPAGAWIGIRTDGVVDDAGAGIASALLYDCRGRLGQSASTIVVEAR